MAKKGEPEKPVESDSDSGEELSSEEVGSDDSDSEPELTQVAKKPSSSVPATQMKAQPQQQLAKVQSSSSSSEDDSGSDSESESDARPLSVKPISSKPMDDPPASDTGAKKSRSKPGAADVVSPIKSTPAKRPAEEKTTETNKKSRKKIETEASEKKPTDDSKKLLFQRLWSEDDEIEILKGIIDYTDKKKSDPLADLSAFHDYIRENLHVDVTRTQLQDKIRRLRKKFVNNLNKVKEGKNRTFYKPHELKAYELSKLIWGNDAGNENDGEQQETDGPKANGGGSVKKASASVSKKKANVVESEDPKTAKKAKFSSDENAKFISIPKVTSSSSVEDRVIKMGADFFETGRGLAGEKEWKRLRVEELEVHLKELDVRRAQAKLVLDALKPEVQ